MGLFKADLYRSFAIGFAIGTAALLGVMGIQSGKSFSAQVIPAAQAAPALPDQTR
ncbi:hypothetical protein [Novosphingobium sp.]|uniref:hypothetical protein n=1 Tax=Novosphingobium sp. TaxID=1874826 RepID=UPI0035AD960D